MCRGVLYAGEDRLVITGHSPNWGEDMRSNLPALQRGTTRGWVSGAETVRQPLNNRRCGKRQRLVRYTPSVRGGPRITPRAVDDLGWPAPTCPDMLLYYID